MAFYLTKPLNIPMGTDEGQLRDKLLRLLGLRDKELTSYLLHRRSVDARDKQNVHFVCSYMVETTRTPRNATPYEPPRDVLQEVERIASCSAHYVVVGAGPAGLFAALYLVKRGAAVTVVERGSDIDARRAKVERFFNGGTLDVNTNVQFGLGGAGTFSDGKLTSGISSPLTYTVFRQFVRSGAPSEILTDALPHVGTDKLADVVAALRHEIVEHGGRFIFDDAVTDLVIREGKVCGVVLSSGGTIAADGVLLACGHSARDVFYRLAELGAEVQFKPFAVGVRIEHGREFINTAQYGQLFATHRDLPAASYKLVMNGAAHSCYTFCMCPGGVVVAASSEENSVVVNGMSNYLRNAPNSNSALVVTVTADDVARYGFGKSPFAGVEFQRDLERKAFLAGGGDYSAPCQNVTDFLAGRRSDSFDIAPSYPRGVKSANLRELLPVDICDAISLALQQFDGKIKGFGSSGVLTAVESRTSSPIRIVRGSDAQSNLKRLYPIGEGAGYAGGIVSSAVDGLRTAMSIL